MRVNSERAAKSSQAVGPGDVLTFAQGRVVRVIRVERIGVRRGPAGEAAELFTDLTPDAPAPEPRVGPRPTKRDRRAIEALRGNEESD